MSKEENKFAERLKDLRLEKEMSQRALSKATGISHTSFVRWENNSRAITLDNFILLAQFFDVSLDYLAGLTE